MTGVDGRGAELISCPAVRPEQVWTAEVAKR